jgi:hypothetical protein
VTGYLERAGVARELKALLLAARPRSAAPVQAATTRQGEHPARPAGPERPEAWRAG